MRKIVVVVAVLALVCSARASWYWPFGSDSKVDEAPPRISELMEPASLLIDEAADFAADGKVEDSIAKYRAALEELDRIELENPDRAKSAEFATLRNKRAYVNAAIDSMLLSQVKANAKAVAVSDTAELEKKLAAERKAKAEKAKSDEKKSEGKAISEKQGGQEKQVQATVKATEPAVVAAAAPKKPASKREQAMAAISEGDFKTAGRIIEELLIDRPNGAAALNLKAVMEAKRGDYKKAEAALDQAIMSNPRSHYAYYNMANLMLQVLPDGKAVARRYYETGRAVGGPVDDRLEAALK